MLCTMQHLVVANVLYSAHKWMGYQIVYNTHVGMTHFYQGCEDDWVGVLVYCDIYIYIYISNY